MHDFDKQAEPHYQLPRPIQYLGAALIALGVIVAVYIVAQLLSIFSEPQANPFVQYISQQLSGAELMKDGNHRFVIGNGGGLFGGIVCFLLFAWIGAMIAVTLIRSGAHLFSPVMQMQLAALKLMLSRLRNELSQAIAGKNRLNND